MKWWPKENVDRIFLVIGILIAPASVICLILIAVAPFFYAWSYFHPPKKFELLTREWECTATYQERVFTGKVWTTITKCANYSRIGINGD